MDKNKRLMEASSWERLTQTCPRVSRSLWWRRGSAVAAAGPGALSAAVRARDLSKEVTTTFITSTTVRPANREGTQPCPSTESWIKDLLSMASPIRTRPSFALSQSLPSGSFHEPLILILQRADRMKTTIRKLSKLITWTTALSNSMKL